MLRDSRIAYRVLASLTTKTELCCAILVDSHIKQNQMVFDSVFMHKKDTQAKMTIRQTIKK